MTIFMSAALGLLKPIIVVFDITDRYKPLELMSWSQEDAVTFWSSGRTASTTFNYLQLFRFN